METTADSPVQPTQQPEQATQQSEPTQQQAAQTKTNNDKKPFLVPPR